MSKESHRLLLRQMRNHEDPSSHEEYALEATHLEVKHKIKSRCGVDLEIQNTRHNVVLALTNDLGAFMISLEHSDFDDPDGVVEGVLECFSEDPDLLDLLVESGYRVMR